MSLLKNCQTIDDKDNAASYISPMEASVQDLKNGKYCCSENHGMPGVISNVKMSKTGKHGHAKFTFNLFFPFTGQTSQEMWPGHTHLSRPKMEKSEFMVTYYDEGDGDVTCIDANDKEKHFTMKANAKGPKGGEIGQKFIKEYEEALDDGKDLWVTILSGPVNDSKGVYYVSQIEKWQAKEPTGDN